ncbi:nuclear pore protein [Planoprotostelium fungivorum]|uniref:Nuclear pore protein n=1 Tax=Planoprotostelium fungivorum TaxID=1890364 RepID=A0A2P6NI94_9EUKA|nr:nuclear pore protein [Planoprotostelium fungivorum]
MSAEKAPSAATVRTIIEELTTKEKSWEFSAYGFEDYVCDANSNHQYSSSVQYTGIGYTPEELRWEAYQCMKKNGNYNEYNERVKVIAEQIRNSKKALLDQNPNAQPSTTNAFNNPSSNTGSVFAQSSSMAPTANAGVFGPSTTPSTTRNVFGTGNTSGSVFGTGNSSGNSSGSVFAKTNTPGAGSVFGPSITTTGSVFGTNDSSGSVFGKPTAPSTTGSVFGTSGTTTGSVFGKPTAPSTTGNVFGTPSTTTGNVFGTGNSSGNTAGSVFGTSNSSGNVFGKPATNVFGTGPGGSTIGTTPSTTNNVFNQPTISTPPSVNVQTPLVNTPLQPAPPADTANTNGTIQANPTGTQIPATTAPPSFPPSTGPSTTATFPPAANVTSTKTNVSPLNQLVDQLTEEARLAFSSDRFSLNGIPETPPPPQLNYDACVRRNFLTVVWGETCTFYILYNMATNCMNNNMAFAPFDFADLDFSAFERNFASTSAKLFDLRSSNGSLKSGYNMLPAVSDHGGLPGDSYEDLLLVMNGSPEMQSERPDVIMPSYGMTVTLPVNHSTHGTESHILQAQRMLLQAQQQHMMASKMQQQHQQQQQQQMIPKMSNDMYNIPSIARAPCRTENCQLCFHGIAYFLNRRDRNLNYESPGCREMSIAILACLQLHDPKEWYTLKDDIYPFLHSHMHLFPQNSKKRSPERQIQDSLSHNKKYFNSARRLAHCNGCWQMAPSYLGFLGATLPEFKGRKNSQSYEITSEAQ